MLAAIRAGSDGGGAPLLRQELDRLIAEQERLAAQVGDRGDGRSVEDALERTLAQVPQAVEECFGNGNLGELADPRYVARARETLADLLSEIVVVPAQTEEGRPCYAVTLKGDLAGAFRLLAGKRKVVSDSDSGGGLSARLTLPRVTFLLSPVRGVPRDRLPEAVKSAIRFVRPADLRDVTVGAA